LWIRTVIPYRYIFGTTWNPPERRKDLEIEWRVTLRGEKKVKAQAKVYISTGKIAKPYWFGAGGTACCDCGIKHYGKLPDDFPEGNVRAVTFYLKTSRSNSYYTTVKKGPTKLKFILGKRESTATSREVKPGEDLAVKVPWVIIFEF